MDELSALKTVLLQNLMASASLTAMVGGRIYDVPPAVPTEMETPYIRLGPFSSQEADAECFESYDVTGQIDVYSYGPGEAASTMEALKISEIVKNVVNAMESVEALPGDHVLSYIKFRSKRVITASDGKTKHVPIVFVAVVDKT